MKVHLPKHFDLFATCLNTQVWAYYLHACREKIGEASENPFEGSANNIPITSLSRTIEIDLREMLDETDLPPPIAPQNHILV